jgi:hypothetical protein
MSTLKKLFDALKARGASLVFCGSYRFREEERLERSQRAEDEYHSCRSRALTNIVILFGEEGAKTVIIEVQKALCGLYWDVYLGGATNEDGSPHLAAEFKEDLNAQQLIDALVSAGAIYPKDRWNTYELAEISFSCIRFFDEDCNRVTFEPRSICGPWASIKVRKI